MRHRPRELPAAPQAPDSCVTVDRKVSYALVARITMIEQMSRCRQFAHFAGGAHGIVDSQLPYGLAAKAEYGWGGAVGPGSRS